VLARSSIEIEGVAAVITLLVPVALFDGWHFYFTKIWKNPAGWRNRITVASLLLISLGGLLLPVMMIFAPQADWTSYAAVADQVNFVGAWKQAGVLMPLCALALCLFGRRRLIAPIAVACVGTAALWFFITMG